MKTKNKILIIFTLVCVLVSSFAICSSAYVTNVNPIVAFPQANFVTYTEAGAINNMVSSVPYISRNTGSLSTVRNVFQSGSVNDVPYYVLRYCSLQSTFVNINGFAHTFNDTNDFNDIVVSGGVYAGGNDVYVPTGPREDYLNGYVTVGFWSYSSYDLPTYHTVEYVTALNDSISIYEIVYPYIPQEGYVTVTSLSLMFSATYQPVYGAEGDRELGYLNVSVMFNASSVSGSFASSISVKDFISALNNYSYSIGTSEGLDIGYDNGFDVGFRDGYDGGYLTGYNEGSSAGYEVGYNTGHQEGYSQGHYDGLDEGYLLGYDSGNALGYQAGLVDGRADGLEEGETIGYNNGYGVGYDEGYFDGLADGEELASPDNWFEGIFDAVYGFFNFELFGDFSIGMVLSVIIAFSCMMWVFKIFAGG